MKSSQVLLAIRDAGGTVTIRCRQGRVRLVVMPEDIELAVSVESAIRQRKSGMVRILSPIHHAMLPFEALFQAARANDLPLEPLEMECLLEATGDYFLPNVAGEVLAVEEQMEALAQSYLSTCRVMTEDEIKYIGECVYFLDYINASHDESGWRPACHARAENGVQWPQIVAEQHDHEPMRQAA